MRERYRQASPICEGTKKKVRPMHSNRRHIRFILALFTGAILLMLLIPVGSHSESTTAISNNGRKWRIGYYEGGEFINYPANLKAIADGLADLGWMARPHFKRDPDSADTRIVWEALGRIHSNYLEFVQDAFWSASWRDDLRKMNRTAAIEQLKQGRIDFMIAMGTWAGQDLVNDLHHVPTMVVSSSDPVKSGIIRSPFDSGFDHVHVRCDPDRYLRQIRLFYSIFRFHRLGLVYEDTAEGRTYAALSDVQRVAAVDRFELVTCKAPFSGVSAEESFERLIQCHQDLAPRIDAYFLTIHRGVDLDRLDELLAPLIAAKIPVWSQRGPSEVRHGALMSISRGNFKAVGRFHARIMAEVFNGAKPRSLNQIFKDPKTIAINLDTAAKIGFTPPKGLMKVVDEIFP